MSLRLPDSMPWRIYQAYLLGPSALLRLFEEAFGHHALYGPPDPNQQQRTIDALSEQVGQLKGQVRRLQAEVSDLRGHNFQLQRRNAELEALVAKDSHNSSRPPSTDPPWAKRTRSLRRPSGRRPGGQAGHRGETLRLTERPDRIVEHRPKECRGCHTPLAAAHVVRHRRQQVVEVVPARLKVTEHRLAVLRCPACGRTTSGEFAEAVRSGVQYGAGVKARVLYLQQYQLLPYQRTSEAMRDLFGCRLSAGTVANIVRECSDGLVETELKIKRGLRRSPVIHTDETGLRVNKRLAYVHVASNDWLTHYAAAAHRGRTAIDEINVLPRYRGTCVHDGLLAYTHYTRCRHALCGVHLLRELTYFEEVAVETKAWAGPLPKEVKEAIDHYLRLDRGRREVVHSGGDQAPLFQPHTNYRTLDFDRALSTRMVQKIVKKWADYSQLGDLSPHDLRRTAITWALESGLTYRQVQMMSKHKDPKTVMRYDHGRENLDQNAVNFLAYDEE